MLRLDNNGCTAFYLLDWNVDDTTILQGHQGGGMTDQDAILVVEDDPLVSEVVSLALGDSYAVAMAQTAQQALGRLRQGGIRLMLLDCTLPGGIDANLIPEAERSGAAVILMSGDPGRMQKLVDQPRPFILKPFTLSGLLETVDAAWASSGGRPGGDRSGTGGEASDFAAS